MAYLGFKPGAAEWLTQTNLLSYGGTPESAVIAIKTVQ